MTIRQYAKQVGHEVVGKLTRHPEWEFDQNPFTGEVRHNREGARHYADEGGNEYIVSPRGVVIIDPDGGVI